MTLGVRLVLLELLYYDIVAAKCAILVMSHLMAGIGEARGGREPFWVVDYLRDTWF